MGSSPAGWVAKALPDESDIARATELCANLVEVERAELPSVLVGVTSVMRVAPSDVEPFFEGNSRPSFVVNIPKESVWTGAAIEVLGAHSSAFGGMGDLRRAMLMDDPSEYVFREYAYVERRLRQHRSVISIDRLYDRVWRVHRRPANVLNLAISNEYDLTADEVRTAYDRYAPFHVLFHTNPLGRITKEAEDAAQELGIEIVKSADLNQRLGR